MIEIVRRGLIVLREEGFVPFLVESVGYVTSIVKQFYWETFRESYTLSIDDTTVTFSAPTYATVRRTKHRHRVESIVLSDLLRELRADDVFYDIGANTGLYTLFAAKNCLQGSVVAFEPYPPNSDLLRRHSF